MPFSKFFRKNDWKKQSRRIAVNQEIAKIGKIFKENLITFIISSFSFVAALNWNQAMQDAIKILSPATTAIYYKFYVAILVTILAVIVTYILSKFKSQQMPA
jgi:C4-dicarboxylate transporter